MKLFKAMIAFAMVLCLFACNSNEANKPVTAQQLAKVLNTEAGENADKVLTNQEVVQQLLLWAGMSEEQLGTYPDDYNAFADSLGMVKSIQNYDPTAECLNSHLKTMKETADVLQKALQGDKREPLFLNGMAQPIFPFSKGTMEEGYSNENSDIIRYSVFVETDYDTDNDGKLDLVKAVVQLPKAAMKGDYKAATVYDARPYIAGCSPHWGIAEIAGDSYDMTKIYSQPAKRTPTGVMTTEEASKQAKSSEWYYFSPHEDIYDYENLEWYDYYLVRGFAFVASAGLGTRGSEGFETCGSDLEIAAFKNIVEWLHGDRVAYTDKTSNIEIKADWSNGNVGMTGRSYSGTTPFGVATTGVEGLKTIVPVAGIASWYEYYNSQGTAIADYPSDQLSTLAMYCAGRYIDEDDWKSIEVDYGNYLHQLEKDQLAGGSNYSDVWANRDYTLRADKIKVPALIVHGVNDFNVRTKQYELMYNSFKKANQPVKLLIHQGAHITPAYYTGGYTVPIHGEQYEDIVNRWFSHYLYGVENEAEKMPEVLAQSNFDPELWTEYASYKADNKISMTAGHENETETITTDYNAVALTADNREEVLSKASSICNATYVADVEKDVTVKGTVAVHFKAALKEGEGNDNLQVNVMLVDLDEKGFPTFNVDEHGTYVNKTLIKENGTWIGGGIAKPDLKQFATSDVKFKVIESGWFDLCNPKSNFESQSAAESIQPVAGEFNEYTVYLQPNIYTVKAGHKLALVITGYDQKVVNLDKVYTFEVDNASILAEIPVAGDAGSLVAQHVK